MIPSIKISAGLAKPIGLEGFDLRGLPRVIVFAGPNGGGKTRALRLLQHVIGTAHDARKQEKDNLDSIPLGKDQERKGLIAPGWTDSQTSAYLAQAAQWREIAAALDAIPNTRIPCVDLTYPISRETRLVTQLNPEETSSAIDLTRAKAGFGSAFSALDGFVHGIARDLFNASHPKTSQAPAVAARATAAAEFNDTLRELCGTEVGFTTDDVGNVVPSWRDRQYRHGELSAGEHTLISWAIVLHRQRDALSNAIVFLDEPELHLHGDACIRAIRALSDHVLGPEGQIWMATHSVALIVGSHQHGTPASQKHSPWVSRDRELSFSYFESFCPAFDPFFSEGLRRERYDSPSMTKS